MRITIKSLQEQLAQSEADRKRYYTLWQETKNQLDDKTAMKRIEREIESNSIGRETRNLMQIIRILAKDPTLTMPVDGRGNPLHPYSEDTIRQR